MDYVKNHNTYLPFFILISKSRTLTPVSVLVKLFPSSVSFLRLLCVFFKWLNGHIWQQCATLISLSAASCHSQGPRGRVGPGFRQSLLQFDPIMNLWHKNAPSRTRPSGASTSTLRSDIKRGVIFSGGNTWRNLIYIHLHCSRTTRLGKEWALGAVNGVT